MIYDQSQAIYLFPFSAFYSVEQFSQEIKKIANFSGYDFYDSDNFRELHQQFLNRQPYRNYKKHTDNIFDRLVSRLPTDLSQLDLLQEAYLDSCLEQHFQKESPVEKEPWFKNENEVWDHFCN